MSIVIWIRFFTVMIVMVLIMGVSNSFVMMVSFSGKVDRNISHVEQKQTKQRPCGPYPPVLFC